MKLHFVYTPPLQSRLATAPLHLRCAPRQHLLITSEGMAAKNAPKNQIGYVVSTP
jgi:hypothetical protein